MRKNKNKTLEKVVGIAIFSALALVVALVCNVIPPVQGFLSLDVKDAVITIAAFTYGPVSAVCISFISALIELLTFSTTGWYGFVMNFVSSAVFSLTATLLYMRRRTLNGALAALFAALGAQNKTDYWAEKLAREAFNSSDAGYPGDEDNGTTSAWFIFATIGQYRLCPGKTEWIKCRRLVKSVKIMGKEA